MSGYFIFYLSYECIFYDYVTGVAKSCTCLSRCT